MVITARSLRIRLTALFALVMLAAIGVLGVLLDYSLSVQLRERQRDVLAGKIALIRNLLRSVPGRQDLAREQRRFADALVGHPDLQVNVLDRDGERLVDLPAFPWPPALVADAAAGRDVERIGEIGPHRYRLMLTSVALGGQSERVVLAFAYQTSAADEILSRLRLTILSACLIGSLVAGALGYLAADKGLVPLRRLAQAAARITAEDLDDRLDVEGVPLELRDLAESFNAMLSRLDESFRRLSAFSSDLAHELRTPLSNLMLHAQVALDRPRSAQDLRSALESGLEELERLSRMVNDMLFLAKADHQQIALRYEPVALGREADKVLDFFEGWAAERGVRLARQGAGQALADRDMVRRMLANLVSNAVRHAAPDSQVDVRLAADAGRATVAVSNRGAGLTSEDCERVFDRFYRVEPARANGDGAGLGLSIVKSIASMHGGSVHVVSAGGFTTFLVALPAVTAKEPQTVANGSSLAG